MRRVWSWLTNPRTWLVEAPEPDVIAVPSDSVLAERISAAHLRLLSALDEQAQRWPEDRDQQLIDLAVDLLGVLEVPLPRGGSGEVPVIPGRSS